MVRFCPPGLQALSLWFEPPAPSPFTCEPCANPLSDKKSHDLNAATLSFSRSALFGRVGDTLLSKLSHTKITFTSNRRTLYVDTKIMDGPIFYWIYMKLASLLGALRWSRFYSFLLAEDEFGTISQHLFFGGLLFIFHMRTYHDGLLPLKVLGREE